MMNVFTVVMAYSITCPIIVPFGQSSTAVTVSQYMFRVPVQVLK